MKNRTFKYILSALFCALIAAFSQICIMLPTGIPLTLQIFIICLTGYLLGGYFGTLSVVIYIVLGAVGVPIFTFFGAGLPVLLGHSGGFIIGFLPLVLMCGIASVVYKDWIKIMLGLIGVILCHIFGITAFSVLYGNNPLQSFIICSAPFLLKDIILCVLAFAVSKQLNKQSLFKGLS